MAKELEVIVGAPLVLILAEQFSYLLVHSRMCGLPTCSDCIRFEIVSAHLMRHFYGEHEQLFAVRASTVD